MKFMLYLSDLMIPFLLFGIIGFGLLSGRDVYQDFLDGAREGLKTIASICPTLIGLMTAVGVLRASGLLKYMGDFLGKILSPLGIPGDIVPLALVRLSSSSAATSLLLNIFKEYGTDSYAGLVTSLALSSTETIFYTMSVYYMAIGITKTRWTLAGAFLATVAGLIMSMLLAGCM